MNRYEFEVMCLCPNGQLRDRYECSLSSDGVLPVEKLIAFANRTRKRRMYQEELADALRNEFMARVVVTGWHWSVKVTCTRE